MSVKSIKFNNFDFQDSNWRTKDITYRNLPNRVLDTYPLARRDGYHLVNAYYSDKSISISGSVKSDTEANLRALVDTMKRMIDVAYGNLEITDGADTVRWVGSVENIRVPEQYYHITQIPFEISFKCQPFGKATTAITSTASVTTASATRSLVVVGSAAPKPIIRWTVAGSPSAAITGITLLNNTTGDTLVATGLSLSGDGDYFEIDTDDMSVVQNTGSGEVELDFTGVFPRFHTSTNSYTVSLVGGGASKTLNQLITYYASYL